jgi:PiT family inorganic phosphate transporter
VHGFATQTVAASVVLAAGFLGMPVSTGQVVSSSLVGVGSAERLSKVRWDMAANLVTAWLLTIPAAAIFSAVIYLAGRYVLGW